MKWVSAVGVLVAALVMPAATSAGEPAVRAEFSDDSAPISQPAYVPACQECETAYYDPMIEMYWAYAGGICDELGFNCADCDYGSCDGWDWYNHGCSWGCTPERELLDGLAAAVESTDSAVLLEFLGKHPHELAVDVESRAVNVLNCQGAIHTTFQLNAEQLGQLVRSSSSSERTGPLTRSSR